MRANSTSIRSVILAIAVAAVSAAPASAVSQFELYGTFTGAGSINSDIFALSPHAANLEWSVGTYSHSGGLFPGGGGAGGGGIDSVLTVAQEANVLAVSDNLSATNRDSNVHTSNITSRPGSVAIPDQLWASSFNVTVATAAGSSLGNGSSTLVSYVPNDGLQFFLLTSATNFVGNALHAVNTYAYTRESKPIALTGGADFTGGGLDLDTADFSADTLDVTGGSISVQKGATLRARYMEFGRAQGDRGKITLAGSGGLDIKQLYLAPVWGDAAVTVDQQSGVVTTDVLSIDRFGSTEATSHYFLNGGKVTAKSLQIADGVMHVDGGTLSVPNAVTLSSNGMVGSKILWNSGGIDIYGELTTPAQTNSFFGGTVDLAPGKTLSVNAPGLSTFVNLRGGKLALAGIADTGLQMNWQSGELQLTGTNGLTVGVGKALGDQVALNGGMTFRVGGTLTTEPFSRVVMNDGSRLFAANMTNNGELALQSTGASLTVNGTLTNWGIIRGSGRLGGTVSNEQNGRIELSEGDSFRLVGFLRNSGQIRLTGGDLLMSNWSLINNTAGRITGRGTISAGSVDNRGTVTLSAGLSDVDATTYFNRTGSKTIVTGAGSATFYGAVTNEAGSEFRISADSRATFLGAVTNLAAFTGTGAKVFDGPASGGAMMTGGSTEVEVGGMLDVAGIRENALVLRGDAAIAANSVVSKVNSLTLDGGTLNLRNNKLVVDYAGASPLPTIQASVMAGEIFSSSLDARTAIAIVEARDLQRGMVGDVAVDSTAVVVALALGGDANIDGSVSFDDLLVLAQNYGTTGRSWARGDFNGDSNVSFDDLLVIAQNYNSSLALDGGLVAEQIGNGAFASDFALALSMTPEPGSLLAIAGLVSLGVARRR